MSAREVEKNILTHLKRFWSDGIRGGDFFISAIGPGMEIFSRYRTILKYSGEQVPISDQLLQIRKISTSFLFRILTNIPQNAVIDETGQFYLAYRCTYGDSNSNVKARNSGLISSTGISNLWSSDRRLITTGRDELSPERIIRPL